MIADIFRFLSFLIPIPFMVLFYIKTNKLNIIKDNPVLVFFILVLIQIIFNNLGYNFGLILAYTVFVLFGASILSRRNWSYPQALSISFCLTYFGSFLWELPIHIYTIIIRGGIDGAFPLHLIFIFPILFVYEKVQTNRTKKEISSTLTRTLLLSTLILAALVFSGFNVWNVVLNSPLKQIIEEAMWMVNRLIVIVGLFAIYAKSSLRGKKLEKKK